MLLSKFLAFLVAVLALAAASMADAQTRNEPSAPVSVSLHSPQFFVTEAAQANLLLIQSSQLAIERAYSDGAKALANLLLDDHRKLQFRLKEVAEKAQLKTPHELDQKRRAELERLQAMAKGQGFEQAWLQMQRKTQEQLLELYAAYAKSGDHKDLKGMAGVAEPVLREHTRRLQQIASQ